jgi:outer membrane protein TolC
VVLLYLSCSAFADEIGPGEWIDLALKNSRALTVARKRMELSKHNLWQAKRDLFPDVTFSCEDKAGHISGLEYDGASYKGKLEETIFDAGKSFYTLSRERIELEKAAKEHDRLKEEIVFEVTKSYWKLASSLISREAFENIFKDIKAILDEARKLYQEGLVTEEEFLESKALFLKLGVRKTSLEKEANIAMLEFRHLLNIGTGMPVEIPAGVLKEIPLAVELDLEKLREIALKNRLEQEIFELEQESKRLNLMIAERQNWPDITLSFSYGSSGEAYKSDRLDLDDEWQVLAKVVLNLWGNSLDYSYDKESLTPVIGSFRSEESERHCASFSLFDRLDKYKKIYEEDIRAEEAREKKESEEWKIRQEVEEAWHNIKKATLNIAATKEELSFREKELKIVDLKKGLGKSNIPELMKAKMAFLEAKLSYIEALGENAITLAELNHAVGLR